MKKPAIRRLAKPLFAVVSAVVINLRYLPTRFLTPADAQRIIESRQPNATALKGPFEVMVWNIYKGGNPDFPSDMRRLSRARVLILI